MARKYPKFYEGEKRLMTTYDNYNGVYGTKYIILEEGGPGKEKETKAWVRVQRCFDIPGTLLDHKPDGSLPYWTYKRFFGDKGRLEYQLDHDLDEADDLL